MPCTHLCCHSLCPWFVKVDRSNNCHYDSISLHKADSYSSGVNVTLCLHQSKVSDVKSNVIGIRFIIAKSDASPYNSRSFRSGALVRSINITRSINLPLKIRHRLAIRHLTDVAVPVNILRSKHPCVIEGHFQCVIVNPPRSQQVNDSIFSKWSAFRIGECQAYPPFLLRYLLYFSLDLLKREVSLSHPLFLQTFFPPRYVRQCLTRQVPLRHSINQRGNPLNLRKFLQFSYTISLIINGLI